MTESFLPIVSTIATFAAALAAWASYQVSKNSLDFQKNYAKNQNLINDLNRIIFKVETLQILMPKPLDISDEEFESLDSLIEELKSELEGLGNRGIIKYNELKISTINTKYELSKNIDLLNEIIQVIENKKSKVFI